MKKRNLYIRGGDAVAIAEIAAGCASWEPKHVLPIRAISGAFALWASMTLISGGSFRTPSAFVAYILGLTGIAMYVVTVMCQKYGQTPIQALIVELQRFAEWHNAEVADFQREAKKFPFQMANYMDQQRFSRRQKSLVYNKEMWRRKTAYALAIHPQATLTLQELERVRREINYLRFLNSPTKVNQTEERAVGSLIFT